jgi:hypothetical protein
VGKCEQIETTLPGAFARLAMPQTSHRGIATLEQEVPDELAISRKGEVLHMGVQLQMQQSLPLANP